MLTVGPGGTYHTIAAAIAAAGSAPDEIRLKSGFVMNEQMFVYRQNLGHLLITSEDAVVSVNAAAISAYLVPEDDSKPMFGGRDGATLPMIGVLFDYGVGLPNSDGVAVFEGSKVIFRSGAGVRRARRGLRVIGGSEAVCYPVGLTISGASATAQGVDFSYNTHRAVHVAFGSRAELPCSDFSHNQHGPADDESAIYVIWGSSADITYSDISYAVGEAVYVRDGSTCCARQTNVSHSRIGYHALHNGHIDARAKKNDPTTGEGASFCSVNALLANGTSTIEAPEVNANDCGGHAIVADAASTIDVELADVMRANGQAVLAVASTVNMQGAVMSSSVSDAVVANRGSNISARDSVVTAPSGKFGFKVSNGSIIAANGTTGTKSQALNMIAAAGIIFG